ncbi:MAG: ABC transporter permease [Opitutaceae bacterium]|jgi:ABC-2 type transport system permease protein|nr:ABC transporter permease [Opitutaceae bacterium]
MHAFLSLIKKEWLAMSRDVHGLLVLFAMPSVFILIMSLALRDTFRPAVIGNPQWAFHDADGTGESAAFLASLPAPRDGRPPAAWKSSGALGRAITKGDVQLGVFIKPGFGLVLGEMDADAKTKDTGAIVTVLAEPGLPAPVKTAFEAEATRALGMQRMRELMRDSWPQDADGVDLTTANLAGLSLIEAAYAPAGADGAPLTAVQQSVPAWLVFGMFFVVVPLSTIFIAEKRQGTLPRLHSLRVPVWLMLAGKVFPFHVVNLIQTVLMMLVGACLVPLCGGDALSLDVSWPALWLMASATSLAAIGFALAVAALVRTTEQATTIGAVTIIVFAALGGVMVPKMVMPAAMQNATAFSPMAWALEGFLDIFARGATAATVLPPSLMLLLFAAAGLCVASWRLKKRT